MKTKYFILGSALCSMMGLGLTSCDNEEFLNVTAYDVVDEAASYESKDNAKRALNGVYDLVYPDDSYDGDWGFKPNLFTGCHPTIDTQATGWDKDWNVQAWNSNSSELLAGWKHVYAGICRANDFLDKLQEYPAENVGGEKSLKYLEGEGRALRGFFYHWLATTFGRVPMLATGENGANTPLKAKAESYAEMWDFIIEDFKAAAELLEWAPWDGEYGRATKGMALAYLGDAYMWKAYRLSPEGSNGVTGTGVAPTTPDECYKLAADCFKQILDSHTYKLNESFTTLWDPASAWGPEAIWVEQLDEGTNWGKWDNLTSKLMLKWYTACPENGGWGSLYLSWEWYSCYETGDKRRSGSCYTGAVPQIDPENPAYDPQYAGWLGKFDKYIYGVNPYLQEVLGKGLASTATKQFHFNNGEWAPAIWSSKMWRTASADYKSWGDGHWSPTPIYWKRLPNVMLDYAECCFRNGNEAEGWRQLDELRNRAFGKLEDGHEKELTDKYMPYYNSFAGWTGREDGSDANGGVFYVNRAEYPIPFGSDGAVVTPAKDYYTQYAAQKGFQSPVWKVAVNTERRREFNCEWCLRPDMQKSGFMADHVTTNYPKRNVEDLKDVPWTNRDYDYNDLKMDMPIPEDEITKNTLCEQNEAYRGSK
ncbi:MAG: RagB/SusD family nutrient uptake outer membrane protein [Bacteroidales bacterium]|nr:RagB/SusD family nutrient uptake outer membrane protein [Bacteroidales bacterium]